MGAVVFEEIALLIEECPRAAALNMAVDERLLEGVTLPLLRVYRWAGEAVSYGYFEPWKLVAAAYPGKARVRRWTGGGVVPHGDGVDWTYSLIVPRRHPFAKVRAAESYRWIHERLAETITALLAGHEVALTADPQEKLSRACFENPVRHDLLADGRKVAGAAQRRSRYGLLHQGSVQGIALPAEMPGALAARLARHVRRAEPLAPQQEAEAEALAAAKYGTAAWNDRL